MTVKIITEQAELVRVTCADCLVQYYDLTNDPSLQRIDRNRLLQQAMVDCDGIVWVGKRATVQNLAVPHYNANHYNPALWCVDAQTGEVFRLHNGIHPEITAVLTQIVAQLGHPRLTLAQTLARIVPPSPQALEAVQHRFANIAIPLGSMGQMQTIIEQLAHVQGTPKPVIDRKAVVVFCADNGVVAQGVTQCGQEITATVTENLSQDRTTVCLMSKHIGATVIPVDIGVSRDVGGVKLRHHKIAYGTQDMTTQPAMTRAQCVQALEVGIALAVECKQAGYQLVAAGEMGIGNTTTSAAMTAVLLGESVETVTGRGAGLSSEGLSRKVDAITRAIALNQPDPNDPLDILSKVGGFDIAGMCGFYLGCAAVGLPCLLDGIISNVAALTAVRLAPACSDYLIASHMTAEPAGCKLLQALGKQAVICANMRLGEGTGAVAGMALLDIALAPFCGMPSFDEIAIDAYQELT